MGYMFKRDDFLIWSPSNDVSMIFLDNVRYWERRTSEYSGICEYMSGSVRITPIELGDFLDELSKWLNFEHEILCALVKGTVVMMMALHIAASDNRDQQYNALYPTEWVNDAKAIASHLHNYCDRKD